MATRAVLAAFTAFAEALREAQQVARRTIADHAKETVLGPRPDRTQRPPRGGAELKTPLLFTEMYAHFFPFTRL